MADSITKEQRSWVMSKIRAEDTKPEMKVRSLLHKLGYRFRLHKKGLPGTPDIVLPKYKTVIFVHGCFWHRHPDCSRAHVPKSNVEYWGKKIRRNKKRDRNIQRKLNKLGWKYHVIWECETSNLCHLEKKIKQIAAEMKKL